jgi:hypothetical protein
MGMGMTMRKAAMCSIWLDGGVGRDVVGALTMRWWISDDPSGGGETIGWVRLGVMEP